MASSDDIRRLALALPEAVEADHHGMPSFRVRGKIFSTIHVAQPRLMVKLDPEDQRNLADGHPGVVEPVPGYWGRKGSTFVWYEKAEEALIAMLLTMAHAGVAPKLGKRGPQKKRSA
jgi:predicted DNA-binding protein (MmcQ/YjbR family)